jgi:predicted RNA-binding protein
MCESNVYLVGVSGEELIAKEVAHMMPKQGGFVFVDIYGNKYEVEGVEIAYIDFLGHKVVLRRRG